MRRSEKDGKVIRNMIDEEQRFRYGELTGMVLEGLSNILIEMGGYPKGRANVILGLLIKYILAKNKEVKEDEIKRTLKSLEKRDLIRLEEKGNKVVVWLEEKGRSRVFEYSIKKLLNFKKNKKEWDGHWFLVFFDVPEIQRQKRDYLRRFLKKMGFYPYQKSVYIFPYECEEEVKLIKQIVEGAKYMKYIVAERIEEEDKFKRAFKL